jgi:2-dehydropantoate 2-reductase
MSTSDTTRSIAIVGPGAIGTTVAAALHEAGRTPLLFGRTPREQLDLRVDDTRIIVPGPVQTDPRQVSAKADLVFLAVKATQIEDAAPWLTALCDENTVICVLQNGVEQVSMVTPHAVGARVLPSVVWFPAETQPDASVWLRGDARLTLPAIPESHVVVDALRGTRCQVELSDDFVSIAWRKLLQNAVAGLMVLTGRRAGMFTRPDIADLASAYLRECLAVARAEGAVLGDEVVADILARFSTAPTDMGTSILADRDAGRPLEWSTRNGVVLRRGREHGIPTLVSELVVALLAAASDGPG